MSLDKPMAVQFAPFNRVEEYRTEIDRLLLAIAKYMIEEGESHEEWVDFTFVSNESSLGDFLCSEEDLASLAVDLQLHPLSFRDLLVDVAITMRQRERTV
jgi:hypothetical protein